MNVDLKLVIIIVVIVIVLIVGLWYMSGGNVKGNGEGNVNKQQGGYGRYFGGIDSEKESDKDDDSESESVSEFEFETETEIETETETDDMKKHYTITKIGKMQYSGGVNTINVQPMESDSSIITKSGCTIRKIGRMPTAQCGGRMFGSNNYDSLILSGPSGSGKGTIIDYLNQNGAKFKLVVSHTTRGPRPNEKDGVHYHFVDTAKFKQMIEDDEFLEYNYIPARDTYYGTSYSAINDIMNEGKIPVFDVDHFGVMNILKKIKECGDKMKMKNPLVVNITTGLTWNEAKMNLEAQLKKRATESEELIQKRLREGEIQWHLQNLPGKELYNKQIVNVAGLNELYEEVDKKIVNEF